MLAQVHAAVYSSVLRTKARRARERAGLMTGLEFVGYHFMIGQLRRRTDEKMQAGLTPEQYRQWRAERDAAETAERRHRELISAIESAGRRF